VVISPGDRQFIEHSCKPDTVNTHFPPL